MFANFHNKNFFAVPLKSWAVEIMIELPPFFPDLRFDLIGDYAILYKDGLDPRQCVMEYLDYGIEYNEDMIRSLTKPSDGVLDFGSSLKEFIDLYEKDIAELKKSRLHLSS